ncbi:MAG TPA: flagellar basal body P-ring formation chaperone FlgA [Caldimonas sp.]|nr:flagellar basal body P-ring formation chaperone FlgA [Caldimonas sp.]
MDARPLGSRFALAALLARAVWLGLGTLAAVLATALIALAPHDARAQAAPADAIDPALAKQIQDLAGAPGAMVRGATRIEVEIGTLDPRLHLAPCQRIEPYLPAGARLWGKTRVGLRCVQGPSPWNVYLPVTVHVWGRALVATGPVAAGSVLQPSDVAEADVDFAESASAALVTPSQAVGRTLAQPLKAGQSVRAGHLRVRQWFAAGDTVRLVATGSGFRLESEGQALSNGIEGQAARVRTESGHVVTGTPVGERLVELAL